MGFVETGKVLLFSIGCSPEMVFLRKIGLCGDWRRGVRDQITYVGSASLLFHLEFQDGAMLYLEGEYLAVGKPFDDACYYPQGLFVTD